MGSRMGLTSASLAKLQALTTVAALAAVNTNSATNAPRNPHQGLGKKPTKAQKKALKRERRKDQQ